MPSWLNWARVGSVAVRTHDDNWDITTSVGSTALFVATARALEAQKPDPLAVDPFAGIFCHAVGGAAADVLDGKNPDHQLKTPDFGEHFVNFQGARTRFFDNYFLQAAEAGVRQVVILAAGLDSRAYRLAWPDGTTIFELDRPQVLDFKREVLAEQGATPNAERREIAIDLREDWPQALRDSGFDASKPSAWIAEGLLIYLPAAARSSCSPGSTRWPVREVTSPSRKARHMPAEAFQRRGRGRARGSGRGRRPVVLPTDLQRAARPSRSSGSPSTAGNRSRLRWPIT